MLAAGSADAWANDPSARVVCDEEAPTLCAAEIRKGEVSPLTGQVITSSLAAYLHAGAEGCPDRTRAAVAHAVATAQVVAAHELHLVEIDRDAAEAERDAAAKLADRAWHEHPVLWVLVGVASMAGAFALARGQINALE